MQVRLATPFLWIVLATLAALSLPVLAEDESRALKFPETLPKLEARDNWQQSLDELTAIGIPHSWLLIGPISDEHFRQFERRQGLEPDNTDDWTAQKTRRWTRPAPDADLLPGDPGTGHSCYVDLTEALGVRVDALVYAQAEIDWPSGGPALLWFDSNGRSVVYLNGRNIGFDVLKARKRTVNPSEDSLLPIPVVLKPGKNIVKVKIGAERKHFEGFGFYCRVERDDIAWRTELLTRLRELYPEEARGWRGAEALLEIARRHERANHRDDALAAYQQAAAVLKDDPGYLAEAEAGVQRMQNAQRESSDQIWQNWKKVDEQFKGLLRVADTSGADALMRDYMNKYGPHESVGNALIFRGGLREDYCALHASRPFYERGLREYSQNEFVAEFAQRGLAFARNFRFGKADVEKPYDIQALIDGARRQIMSGDPNDVDSAIRTLLDALNRYPGSCVRVSDSELYPLHVGLRQYVRSLAGASGGQALAALRRQLETEASARLETAKALADVHALESVVWEFPGTAAAASALSRIGDLESDRGQWAEAAQDYKRLQREYRLPAGSAALLAAKLARAAALSGDSSSAEDAIAKLSTDFAAREFPFGSQNITGAAFCERLRTLLRNKVQRASAAVRLASLGRAWTQTPLRSASAQTARSFWPEDTQFAHLQSFPIASGNHVFVSALEGIQNFDLSSGRCVWQQSWDSKGSLLAEKRSGILFTGFPVSCPALSDGHLYLRTLEGSQSALRCYAQSSGALLWNTATSAPLRDMVWLSDPLITGGLAIAVFLENPPGNEEPSLNTHGVAALDAETGALCWKRKLATGAMGRVVERVYGRDNKQYATYRSVMQLGPPTASGGVVYAPTGLGSLAALNAQTGELIWLAGYPQFRSESLEKGNSEVGRFLPRMLKMLSRGPSSPVIAGDVVVLAPKDSPGIVAFDRQNGTLRWHRELIDSRFVAGVCDGNLLAVDSTVHALSLKDGRTAWEFTPKTAGRGLLAQPALAASMLYLPFEDSLQIVDARSGQSRGSLAWDAATGPLGNLVFADGFMVGVNNKVVAAIPVRRDE